MARQPVESRTQVGSIGRYAYTTIYRGSRIYRINEKNGKSLKR